MASNKRDLKAFVRYDGTGRVIPGSLILQRNKPKVGNWNQTTAYECCDPSCQALVYDDDFIVADIGPYGIDQADIIVLINPSANFSIQGGLFDCDGNLITLSPVLTTLFPGQNDWIVLETDLFSSCSIKFRKVCFGGTGTSQWMTPSFG